MIEKKPKCPCCCSSDLVVVEVGFQEFLYCQECLRYFLAEDLEEPVEEGG